MWYNDFRNIEVVIWMSSDFLDKTFEFCFVTNTRLMGVVVMHIRLRSEVNDQLDYLFHLDFEDYGIDGYSFLENVSPETLNHELMSKMGGLGGSLVELDLDQGLALLKEAYSLNEKYNESLPEACLPWVAWTDSISVNKK